MLFLCQSTVNIGFFSWRDNITKRTFEGEIRIAINTRFNVSKDIIFREIALSSGKFTYLFRYIEPELKV